MQDPPVAVGGENDILNSSMNESVMDLDIQRQVHPLKAATLSDIFPFLRMFRGAQRDSEEYDESNDPKFEKQMQNFLNKKPAVEKGMSEVELANAPGAKTRRELALK